MHQPAASESLEEITIRLGELTIDIRVSRAAATGSVPSQLQSVPEITTSARGSSGPTGHPTEVPREVITTALLSHTVDQFSALELGDLWRLASRLRGTDSLWTPRARIGRAFKAGAVAALRLEGQVTDLTVPGIPYKNSIYVILRAPKLPEGGWTPDYRKYVQAVQTHVPGSRHDFHQDSVSHAFASQAEAEAFLAGAGKQWPRLLQ